jgi:ferredoxin-NADP reductase
MRPTGFIANARQILTSAGVDQSRISQESFGEKPGAREPKQPFDLFARSVRMTCRENSIHGE